MTFRTQPYIYPEIESGGRVQLRRLMRRARNATTHDDSLKIAIISSSIWAVPGGSGHRPFEFFCHQMTRLFNGVLAATPVMNGYGNDRTYLGIGTATQSTNNGTLTKLPSTSLPPPSTASDITDIVGGTADTTNGFLAHCGYDNSHSHIHTLKGRANFPNTGCNVRVYARRQPGSATGIHWKSQPDGFAGGASPSRSTDASGDEDMGLNAAVAEPTIVSADVGPISGNAGTSEPYPQIHIWSNADGEDVELYGVRWLNTDPKGAIIDTWSGGGYRSFSLFGKHEDGTSANHPDMIPFLASFEDYDIIIIYMGANDAYIDSRTPAEFKNDIWNRDQNTAGLVTQLYDGLTARGQNPLFVLCSEPHRADQGGASYATQLGYFEQYADQLKAVVDEMPGNAIFWNVGRFMEDIGWDADSETLEGLTDQGTWSGATAYVVDDYVTHNSRLWKSILNGTNKEPGTTAGDSFWSPVRVFTSDGTHYSEEGGQAVASSLVELFARHDATTTPALLNRPKGVQRNLTSRLTY